MDNSGKYNLISVKFAQAEQPKFEERKGQGFIQYGANNDYPEYLLTLYKSSSKHGSIIKGKANYIYGKGFNFPAELKANSKGETWNCIFKKAVKDDEIFSGYYLQIIYNLEGKIKDVFHIDFKKVRTNKEQNMFFVKNDWTDNREKARPYPGFNGKYNNFAPAQILYVRQYNPGDDVYPTPNYYQALNYIESDVQVSRHILGNAKDGFVATTAINLNNGEPSEEQKEQVEKEIKKKFTGSEGDRVLLFFNRSKETAAEVIPLSQTMLTKEDFTNINNLIQQEIFAGHQITSPMLFGIKTEGQLGGRSEIQDAYEIFNNTYVNERQQAHEEVFNRLLSLTGITGSYTITPVEPLGFALKEDFLLDVMPREYFLDKLGVDHKYYSMLPARASGPIPPMNDVSGNIAGPVNENLAGMSGRKFQQLERIVRKYKAGKLTRSQAAMMLKNSFGVTDDEVALFLDEDSEDHKFEMQDEIDFALINQFSQVGEPREAFKELSRKDAVEAEYFADVQQLTQLESNILNLIKKDKRITPEVLATVLKQDKAVIQQALISLEEAGLFTVKITSDGQDEIPERTVTDASIKSPKPTTTEILLRYSYDGPKDDKNRPFCAKLMELNRLYSRADIETISERLGYSVWDRRGGWFTQPNGEARPYCRHRWYALTVVRKKS